MKIIYISKSIIPSKTANSIHVMKMCQAFASLGHEVTLLCPGFKEQYEKTMSDDFDFYNVEKNFKLVKLNIPKVKGRTFLYALKVLYFILKNNTEIIYGRFLLGCYLSVLFGKKVVFESHASLLNENNFTKTIFKKLLEHKNFLKLVVISNKLKEMYINKKVNKEILFTAHDGADEVENLDTTVPLKGESKLNIGYIGHLYKGKGMEVIENIASSLPQFSFHVVGGTKKDIEYWSDKISSQNVFFYGFVTQNLVQKYINSMAICLLPNQKVVHTHGSTKQNISDVTSPLKMFEYMASKKAIVSSNLPVLKEVLNEHNSIMVECDDYDAWIAAIKKLEDKSLREKIALHGYEDFQNNFSWKNRAKNILDNLK